MSKKPLVLPLVILLFIPTFVYAETADEPDGAFGLKFGTPIPSEFIVDKDDPKFESALQKLNRGEQALARGNWLEAIFDDLSAIPDELRDAFNDEP